MVELAWRVSRFQPQYRAVRRWGPLLQNAQASAAARKKALVVLARRLSGWTCGASPPAVSKAEELGLCSKKQ